MQLWLHTFDVIISWWTSVDFTAMDGDIAFQAILILLIFFSSTSSARSQSPRKVNTKIVGGEVTDIGLVPYLVNLRQDGYFICGGTLITAQCVLTAAHCTQGVNPSQLIVFAGASRLSENGESRQVVANFVSPFFSRANLDMDVAILKLNAPLHGANIATVPICNTRPGDGQLVKISGWGVTNEGDRNPPDQVRTVNVPVISKMACMQAYAGAAPITSSMFCASVPGEKDSCSGDSGGPVIYNGQVCGIVSWGFGCASPTYPGVYTNVASLRVKAFLRSIVSRNC